MRRPRAPAPGVTQRRVRRVRLAGMKITRPPISIGHYKMVKHKSDKGNEENPHRYGGRRRRGGRGAAGGGWGAAVTFPPAPPSSLAGSTC